MKIHSKFRTLFLIRTNILFFLFAFFCLNTFFNGLHNGDFKIIIGSIMFFVLSLFLQINNLRSINKFIVSEEGVNKTSLVSNKEEFIPFSSFVSVRTERVAGSYSDAGQITTGYFESIILLENGTELLISPDHFENYHEMIVAIREKVQN